jgi:hypothetical protein
MKISRQGCTRTVFVLKNKVIKIPTFKSFELFLCGLLSNLREGWRYEHFARNDLAKVFYYNRFGLFLIMERIEVCDNDEAHELYEKIHELYQYDKEKEFMLDDLKPSNWGRKDGKLIKIDYGG